MERDEEINHLSFEIESFLAISHNIDLGSEGSSELQKILLKFRTEERKRTIEEVKEKAATIYDSVSYDTSNFSEQAKNILEYKQTMIRDYAEAIRKLEIK